MALRGTVLAVLAVAGLALLPVPAALASGPGTWTQTQVNTAIVNGVAYIDSQQNANGSFGNGSVAETGIALAGYGVLASGNFSSLSPTYQAHVKKAITFLLSNVNPGPGIDTGAITNIGYPTYETGLALTGLSYFTTVDPGVPAAIAGGRSFLTNEFQGPAYTGCVSADGSPTSDYCGGWNYDSGQGRSDESNTGYAMTGLRLTGGIPPALVADNINWQRHIQVISTNPFTLPANGGTGANDGGGAYQPFYAAQHPNGFSSNANDSGTMLFGFGDDGVPASDPNVAAAIKFDTDVLDSYELQKAAGNGRSMIYHTGATEDGSCTPDSGGTCDWFTAGDGGYHYSLFALTKGFGTYIAPNLGDPTNWYAKVVDLLLSQQASDGSWPPDGRDDFTTVFTTGLSVASLGLVAAAPTGCTMTSGNGTTISSSGQLIRVENAVNSDTTQPQHLVLRSLSGPTQYFKLTSLTSAQCQTNAGYPNEEGGSFNAIDGNGTGSFGSSFGHTTGGYSIHFEIADRGDGGGHDNTTVDHVGFTIKNSGGTIVWQGRANLSSGSEEESG